MKNTFNLFKKKNSYGDSVNSPEDRVKAFISHWYEQWSKAQKKMGEDVDFDYWGNQISEVDETHFAAGRNSGSKNSFGSPADYDPKTEKITECEIDGENAQVFTELYREALKSSNYHVYELVRDAESGWKITEIFTLFHPPKSPVIDLDKHTEILAMSVEDAPFMDREEHIDLNENTLFQKDRNVKVPHLDEGVARLEQIGSLRISSGVVGILDFGYDIYDFEPLQRKVKPGEYPVETVTIHDRVAGIRVKFTDSEKPMKWHAANTPSGNGVYGVDAGNLAIFDVNNLMELNRIGKEKIFNEWCMSGKPELVSMTGKNDCVISTSGFGDGAYPAYWGVNEKDEIISLYIDFMILVKENENGLYESI
ncbi:DUF4241 domain-containing protein [Marinobacter daepoensis]|uniref:DUF4241 domain-containing protein n=1 Tax=Marinobacter daepoensis TaxID=262077 RepID=A0ABS3BDL9_9GAMM|nr:DUF4241 domain-containing protein [Marinobacter daepoensis]MBN7768290.1 DUF4241 domain-containing protein [Marinobacter daepoensis]MBY6034419.1 DUF4241 domain-containing protein [Marinobacter daepoensis]MBY6080591.1 DUF4241 domain-containing protein [Marinobacter daepoensis]